MTSWRLAVEVGFGSGPFDLTPTWVDVTDHMWGATAGPEISAVRGRAPESGGITAGTLGTVFDNTNGVFDPENAAGPFYGDLDPFTPIRILAGPASGPLTPIWRGSVDSWPIIDSAEQAVMEVEAVDLFGLLAQGTAPATAFDAAVASNSVAPDYWWRPGPTGWVDRVSGATMAHTSGLTEIDHLINGDEHTFGQSEPDGWGRTFTPTDLPDGAPAEWTVASMWVQLVHRSQRPPVPGLGWPSPVILVNMDSAFTGDITGVKPRLLVMALHTGIRVQVTTTVGSGNWGTETPLESDTLLMDGDLHHVLVAARPPHIYVGAPPASASGGAHIWIDGRHFDMSPSEGTGAFLSVTRTPGGMEIGGTPPDGMIVPYQGVIDHVMMWSRLNVTVDWAEQLAQSLFTAGRFGWAGQRLDERAANLVTAMNAGDLIGSFDVSGITTLQSYRQGDVLQSLQTIEDTEQGQVNLDATGRLRYWNRQWAWNRPRSTTIQATFTDEPAANWSGPKWPMLPEGLVRSRDIRKIVTTAQVTSAFGRMQSVEAAPEIRERYGSRGNVHLSGLLHHSDAESRAIAEWIIATRSQPRTRVEQISFRVDDRPDVLLPFAQAVDLGDRVAVERNGVAIEGHVTSVDHQWSTAGWFVTLSLDSTRTDSTWFRWGTSTWNNTVTEGWSF